MVALGDISFIIDCMSDRLTSATINLGYYSHNISKICKLVSGEVKVMAVVKANAYGHGIERIAKTAITAGASYLGVVSLGELKRIRNASIHTPVLILNYLDSNSLSEAIKLNSSITVMDEAIVLLIEKEANKQSKNVNVHIKLDTGMHRAGCDPDRLLNLAQKIQAAPHLILEGLFTHFAESEVLDAAFTHQQLKLFNQAIDSLKTIGVNPPLFHCANSAAIINFPETHFTMVRPGLISYGLNPFPKDHPKYTVVAENFRPVLSLKTQVVFIRVIEPGETVGYNRRWQAKRQSRLALLPVGYGDGYRRTPYNAGKVIINGQYVPIVGSVAMDQTVVDITDIQGPVAVGDEVVLIGKQNVVSLTADDLATSYNTVNYEVVTALQDRIDRDYGVKA